jgi:predicted dehydrogenase
MSQSIKAVLFGAGLRGAVAYAPYALANPKLLKFVAVAEPDPERRARFAAQHNIPNTHQFASWEAVLAKPQMADVVFNCTQDQLHYASSIPALEAGYDMLLEKPMTNTLAETVQLVQTAAKYGRLLQICHVLRFTPFYSTLNAVLKSGRLGDIITVSHRENVAYHHMAHSFVRGNWRNTAESSPMILAKCCHDMDILYWNLGMPVKYIQSFGSLRHFHPENAPPGATQRCTDGCPAAETCPFDARRVYLDMSRADWGIMAMTNDLSLAGRQAALETGPYGRCVYACDNDVVDNQIVNMVLENGTTVALAMHGHSHAEGRTMRYDGTLATLRATTIGAQPKIEIHHHLSGKTEIVKIPPTDGSGHGGGDSGVVHDFVRAMRADVDALTSARASLESHLMAFAAEESRLNNTVVTMAAFRAQAEETAQ